LKEIHKYDVLRADRGIASNGLEARVPFLNYEFVDFYMSINPALRMPVDGIEKYLLRKSFDGFGYLPDEVLFRKKEAFSDGVSSESKSWYEIIQDRLEDEYGDDFEERCGRYSVCTPNSKEALYYREVYEKWYGGCEIVERYWLPNWCGDIKEPSARVLEVY